MSTNESKMEHFCLLLVDRIFATTCALQQHDRSLRCSQMGPNIQILSENRLANRLSTTAGLQRLHERSVVSLNFMEGKIKISKKIFF